MKLQHINKFNQYVKHFINHIINIISLFWVIHFSGHNKDIQGVHDFTGLEL